MRLALTGATGLVGSLLAPRLVAAGYEVHTLQRRSDGRVFPHRHEHVAPTDRWAGIVATLAPEAAICALGTTMGKAGSPDAFAAIDRDLVLAFARAARAAGARHLIAVSSVGADPASRHFYLRLKGEVERALAAIGFERLDLLRPGLLRGARGADRRLGERIGILLSPLANLVLRGPLDPYAAIDAELVAGAAVALLRRREPGTFVHHNRALRALAASRPVDLPSAASL